MLFSTGLNREFNYCIISRCMFKNLKIKLISSILSIALVYSGTVVYAQTTPSGVSSSSATINALSSLSLSCASGGIKISWSVPSGTSSIDSIDGYVTDTNTSSNVYTIPSQQARSYSLVWKGGNNKDTYTTTAWIQNASGQKSQTLTSSPLDSSSCSTSFSSSGSLSCNNFVVTQNGNTGNTVTSSSPVSISSGITSSDNSSINYSNATWSTSSGTLTPTSSNSAASWSNGTNTSSSVTITLSNVTDTNGATLSSPCSVTLTVDNLSNLPATGFEIPTYVLFVLGFIFILLGLMYSLYLNISKDANFKRKFLRSKS